MTPAPATAGPTMARHRTSRHRTSRQRALRSCKRRQDRVTFTGTLSQLLGHLLHRWRGALPAALHDVAPCPDQTIVQFRSTVLWDVLLDLGQKWAAVGDALRAAGFLAPLTASGAERSAS